MWIRRSEEEIQKYMKAQEARRKSLLRPLLFALVLTVVALILYLIGYRGGSLRTGIVMFSDPRSLTLGIVFPAVFLFVTFFASTLLWQRRRTLSATDSVLCRECKEPSHPNAEEVCECGGKLEPFAFFTWTEDAKQVEP
jgi:hypothetical protein